MKTLNSSPPANKVETSENKSSLLDGFMADLDAILKKGGVTLEAENQSKSLPRLHPFDQVSFWSTDVFSYQFDSNISSQDCSVQPLSFSLFYEVLINH